MSRVLQGINGIQSTEDHFLDVYPVNVLVIQEAVNQTLVRPSKVNSKGDFLGRDISGTTFF